MKTSILAVWEPEDGAVAGRAPLTPATRAAMRAWVMRDWATAARLYGAIAESDPTDAHALARKGDARAHLGEEEAGLADMERARANGARDAESLLDYAAALHHAKRYKDAARSYEELAANEPMRQTAYYDEACAYALAGDRDAAFVALERAVNAGMKSRGMLEQDQDLATLRSDPRYARILSKL